MFLNPFCCRGEILRRHNEYREDVRSGKVGGMPETKVSCCPSTIDHAYLPINLRTKSSPRSFYRRFLHAQPGPGIRAHGWQTFCPHFPLLPADLQSLAETKQLSRTSNCHLWAGIIPACLSCHDRKLVIMIESRRALSGHTQAISLPVYPGCRLI